jgi:Transposase DDE domain
VLTSISKEKHKCKKLCFARRWGWRPLGENTLAREVLGALNGQMLCLADRGFSGFERWRQALATNAQLLWRIRKNAVLPCDRRLADGSYLSRIYPCERDKRHRTNAIEVRVIEYRLQGVADAEPIYHLLISVLEQQLAPAPELAALYHERWEIEAAFDAAQAQRFQRYCPLCRGKPFTSACSRRFCRIGSLAGAAGSTRAASNAK